MCTELLAPKVTLQGDSCRGQSNKPTCRAWVPSFPPDSQPHPSLETAADTPPGPKNGWEDPSCSSPGGRSVHVRAQVAPQGAGGRVLTGFSVWAIPMTKTSWEEKSAAMRFLWMPFRLERSVRTSARSTKATSSAASYKDTAA